MTPVKIDNLRFWVVKAINLQVGSILQEYFVSYARSILSLGFIPDKVNSASVIPVFSHLWVAIIRSKLWGPEEYEVWLV